MLVDFFKCLADDTRLKILLLITAEQELCVCELTHALALSQPKISRHIALLRKAGLLADRRAGKWVYYRLSTELDNWQIETISSCLANNPGYLVESGLRLREMGNRPQRQELCCE